MIFTYQVMVSKLELNLLTRPLKSKTISLIPITNPNPNIDGLGRMYPIKDIFMPKQHINLLKTIFVNCRISNSIKSSRSIFKSRVDSKSNF